MMRYYIIILCTILVFTVTTTVAQPANLGAVFFENVKIEQSEGVMNIDLTMKLDHVTLRKQDLMILVPVLQQKDGPEKVYFDPVLVAGKTRYKALERSFRFNNYKFGETPSQYVRRENGEGHSLKVESSVPFEEWMRNAQITFSQSVTGCRDCPPCVAEYNIDYRLPEHFVPDFKVAYITPEAEPVKRRSETFQARLNFVVDKYDLLRDFGNNGNILNEVDGIVSEIRSDEALTIETLKVTGYASPEGNYEKNMLLSRNRAYAFVNYLANFHNLQESMIMIDWKGEDWEGLRKVVEESDIEYKQQVLDIIDNNSDITQRKRKLEALQGGSVYKFLLASHYPPLRRNEYVISYVARQFDIEEAKALIRTKPQYLSLNEMFLVANSYPKDSEEFKEVFDIAVRMFPDNEVARINCAAQEIEDGRYEAGIRRISDLTLPEALNNTGVAHAGKGEWMTAGEFFERAAKMGLEVARYNLSQTEKAIENNK